MKSNKKIKFKDMCTLNDVFSRAEPRENNLEYYELSCGSQFKHIRPILENNKREDGNCVLLVSISTGTVLNGKVYKEYKFKKEDIL